MHKSLFICLLAVCLFCVGFSAVQTVRLDRQQARIDELSSRLMFTQAGQEAMIREITENSARYRNIDSRLRNLSELEEMVRQLRQVRLVLPVSPVGMGGGNS